MADLTAQRHAMQREYDLAWLDTVATLQAALSTEIARHKLDPEKVHRIAAKAVQEAIAGESACLARAVLLEMLMQTPSCGAEVS